MPQATGTSSKITYKSEFHHGQDKFNKLATLLDKIKTDMHVSFDGTKIHEYKNGNIIQKFRLYYHALPIDQKERVKTAFQNSKTNSQHKDDLEAFFHIANQNRSSCSFFQRTETETTKKLKEIIQPDTTKLPEPRVAEKFTDDHRASISTLDIGSIKNKSDYLAYHKALYERLLELKPSVESEIGENQSENEKEFNFILSILITNPYTRLHDGIHNLQLEYAKNLTQGTKNFGSDLDQKKIISLLSPKDYKKDKLVRSREIKHRFSEEISLKSKALFMIKNSELLSLSTQTGASREVTRKADPRFVTNVSGAKSSRTINNGAIINLYDTNKVTNQEIQSTRIRCGTIRTENAAKQYVLKMILENMKQDGDTIHIIDTRYLAQSHIEFSKLLLEKDLIKNHRKYIDDVIKEITDKKGHINWKCLYNLLNTLKADGLLSDEDKSISQMLQNFVASTDPTDVSGEFLKKKIKFISLDLAPSKSALHGKLITQDTQTIENLKDLQKIFNAKLSTSTDDETKTLLADLDEIDKMSSSKRAPYLAGKKAFYLDEIISRLSEACGFVTSCGCKSNKDRSTSEYVFSLIVNRVFNQRKEKKQTNFSLLNFTLETPEEKQMARNIFFSNPHFMVTLLNEGYGGNKNDSGLEAILEQAFNQDKESIEFYRETLHEYSKFSKY